MTSITFEIDGVTIELKGDRVTFSNVVMGVLCQFYIADLQNALNTAHMLRKV